MTEFGHRSTPMRKPGKQEASNTRFFLLSCLPHVYRQIPPILAEMSNSFPMGNKFPQVATRIAYGNLATCPNPLYVHFQLFCHIGGSVVRRAACPLRP